MVITLPRCAGLAAAAALLATLAGAQPAAAQDALTATCKDEGYTSPPSGSRLIRWLLREGPRCTVSLTCPVENGCDFDAGLLATGTPRAGGSVEVRDSIQGVPIFSGGGGDDCYKQEPAGQPARCTARVRGEQGYDTEFNLPARVTSTAICSWATRGGQSTRNGLLSLLPVAANNPGVFCALTLQRRQ